MLIFYLAFGSLGSMRAAAVGAKRMVLVPKRPPAIDFFFSEDFGSEEEGIKITGIVDRFFSSLTSLITIGWNYEIERFDWSKVYFIVRFFFCQTFISFRFISINSLFLMFLMMLVSSRNLRKKSKFQNYRSQNAFFYLDWFIQVFSCFRWKSNSKFSSLWTFGAGWSKVRDERYGLPVSKPASIK